MAAALAATFAPSPLEIANANQQALLRYLDMPRQQWAKMTEETEKLKWWKLLKIGRPAAVNGNVAAKLGTLRDIFSSPYIDRGSSKWLRNLLDGKVQCIACCGRNLTLGFVECSTDKVGRHLGLEGHKEKAAKLKEAKAQRIDLMPQGVQHAAGGGGGGGARDPAHTAAALVVGSFAAGTHGAAGVPPTSIPLLLNKDMLGLLQNELRNGIPTAPTISSSTLPLAVTLVEERIALMLRGQPISLYIDGGSSKLADGRKIVCVCASSLDERVGTVLLDVLVMEVHETSDSQFEQIEALVAKYDILPKNVHYLCADNASPNKATVDKLNEKGYSITYARCLPHCLNLVVRAFMNVMDKDFKFSSYLKLLRSFMTAGGGVARKLLALEFGFTASGVDFCDTRWASLVFAILYVANKQSAGHLKLAEDRLKELSAAGDQTATDALKHPASPQVVFNVVHDFVESVLEENLSSRRTEESDDVDRNELSLPEAKKKLLKYFSQPLNYLAFQLIDLILGGDVGDKTEKLPTLFSITQGNPEYAARLKSSTTGEVPNAVQATRNLLKRLKGLHYRWTGEDADVDVGSAEEQTEKKNVKARLGRVFAQLKVRAAEQAAAVVENCKVNQHDIKDKKRPFDQERADEWLEGQAELYTDSLQPKLEAALAAAVLAVDGAAGLVKTEECVTGLESSQIFDMNRKSKDIEDDGKLLEYLCFTGGFAAADDVLEEWREYVKDWRAPAATMKPAEVYAAWQAKVESMPRLAPHAMRQFSRPISSAACERVFSYLEDMDSSDRRRMQKKLLRDLLFLRGNHEVLDQLVREENGARLQAVVDSNNGKRARKGE